MGLLLLVFVLPPSLVVFLRRRRLGVNRIVPFALVVYSLVQSARAIVTFVHLFASIAGVDPSRKATLLALGISELFNSIPFWLLLHIPFFAAVYFLDRRLREPVVR